MSFILHVLPDDSISISEQVDEVKITMAGVEYPLDMDDYDYLKADLSRWSEYEIKDGKVVKRGNNG